jgi:hypothetical protein
MRLQRKRLLALADYLDRVKRERFDMATWYHKTECGTTACAMGHACMMRRFQKLGLKLRVCVFDQASRVPYYKGYEELGAADKFFGLDRFQSKYLFGNVESRSPKAEAAIIRQFVNDPSVALKGVSVVWKGVSW